MEEKLLEDKSIKKGFYFICFGAFFIMLSLATHLPAYPHMLANFELDAGYAVWMQLGLALGLTGFQPLLGWLGDDLGIKAVILLGAVFMVIGSVLVAFSPAFWVLVVGLFFKGLSGAAIAPAGVAYAGMLFTGKQRGSAIGTFTAVMAIGALFGPLLSGVFVDTLGWASIFLVTAAFGCLSCFFFFIGVPIVKMKNRRSLDLLGVLFVLIVLVGLLTIPTFINNYGFSSSMWLPSLAVFIIGLVLLVAIEKRKKEPLLDIEYTIKRSFWVPTVTACLMFVGYSGVMYLLTFFVQNVQGKSATIVGVLQMAIFLGSAGAAILSGRVLARFNPRMMLGVSMAVFATGLVMLTMVNMETSFLYLFISMCLIGIGSGSTGPVFKSIIVSKAATSRINVVTFTNTVIENIAQRLGASFALVAFALFAANGNAVSALSNTAWIFIGLVVVSALLIVLIPKRIEGIHEISSAPMNDMKADTKGNDTINL